MLVCRKQLNFVSSNSSFHLVSGGFALHHEYLINKGEDKELANVVWECNLATVNACRIDSEIGLVNGYNLKPLKLRNLTVLKCCVTLLKGRLLLCLTVQ